MTTGRLSGGSQRRVHLILHEDEVKFRKLPKDDGKVMSCLGNLIVSSREWDLRIDQSKSCIYIVCVCVFEMEDTSDV